MTLSFIQNLINLPLSELGKICSYVPAVLKVLQIESLNIICLFLELISTYSISSFNDKGVDAIIITEDESEEYTPTWLSPLLILFLLISKVGQVAGPELPGRHL